MGVLLLVALEEMVDQEAQEAYCLLVPVLEYCQMVQVQIIYRD